MISFHFRCCESCRHMMIKLKSWNLKLLSMSCMFSFCLLENLPQSTLSPKSMARIEGLEEGRPDGVRCSAVLHLWQQVKYCRQKNSVWITAGWRSMHQGKSTQTRTNWQMRSNQHQQGQGSKTINLWSMMEHLWRLNYGYRMQHANECTTKTQNAYYCNRTLSNFVWADMFRQSQARISE